MGGGKKRTSLSICPIWCCVRSWKDMLGGVLLTRNGIESSDGTEGYR